GPLPCLDGQGELPRFPRCGRAASTGRLRARAELQRKISHPDGARGTIPRVRHERVWNFFATGGWRLRLPPPMPKAKAKTSNIHAVVGSDESEVKRVAAELAAKLAPPDAGEFGVEVIDACADNVDQAVSKIR